MGSHPNRTTMYWKYYLIKMNLIPYPTEPHSLAAHSALRYCVLTPRITWLGGICDSLLPLASLVRQCHSA